MLNDGFRKTLRIYRPQIRDRRSQVSVHNHNNNPNAQSVTLHHKKYNHVPHPSKLNILSWNINDAMDSVLGEKTSNVDFISILSNYHIFCLQETKRDIKVPNYRCFNRLCNDSRSGALSIGIHNDLVKHFKIINTDKYPDIQAVRLSRNLTSTSKDVIIVNVYDSPIQLLQLTTLLN